MLRRVVIILLACTLIVLMCTPLDFEVVHEAAGIMAFALTVIHLALNQRWFITLFKGRYTLRRALQNLLDVALILCIIGLAISSVVISRHVFGFLPAIDGASWARTVHLLCSNWLFVVAFVHFGMHVRMPKRWRSKKKRGLQVVWYTTELLLLIAGIWAGISLDIVDYLTLQTEFFFSQGLTMENIAMYVILAAGLASFGSLMATLLGPFSAKQTQEEKK